MGHYRRIMIVGPPGSGKTTMSRKISEEWGLPLFHIDRLFFGKGWCARPTKAFVADQEAMINTDRWVADGNATSHFGPRAAGAQMLIYLHPPRWLCPWRIVLRRWRYHGRHRDDRPDNARERLPWGMIRYTWQYEKRYGARIRDLARTNPSLRYVESRKKAPLELTGMVRGL